MIRRLRSKLKPKPSQPETPARAECDVCCDRPQVVYRVVNRAYETVWSGGCRNCAYMIAGDNPELAVVPETVYVHA